MMNFTTLTQTVTIGGQRVEITALPCGTLRYEVMPLIDQIADGDILKDDTLDKMLSVCHKSIAKADPTVTLEQLRDGLMLTDVASLFQQIIRLSGLNRKDGQQGEASPQSFGATSTGL
jgi:hypothetical protein